jgi:type IV secretion system protein VirD4
MVAGTPPIRAKKARYFEDKRLRERLLPPPKRDTPETPAGTIAPQSERESKWDAVIAPIRRVSPPPGGAPASASDDSADGGIRREPELPEHEEIVPPTRTPADEFDPTHEAPPETPRRQDLDADFIDVARRAALDKGDDMGLA